MSEEVCPRCGIEVEKGAIACEDCGHMFIALASDAVGHKVGNLEIVSKIASGGMGTVWRAEHQSLRTPYAVKVLHQRFSADATVAERFRREAVACSKLRHPNVVFVTDFGFHEDLGIYLIMEFVEGLPLSELLKKNGGKLPLMRAARITEQIAEAIQAAHEIGIVHRDLKPDNVMIVKNGRQRDFVKVLDFGIARVRESENAENLTRAGLVLGTPAYISPEQVNAEADAVGPRTDVYSLGCILYEIIAGQPPFEGGTDFEILSQHVFKAPEPISNHREDLAGTSLEALIDQMLFKRPHDRPDSMDAVLERLGAAMAELADAGIADVAYPGRVSGEYRTVGRESGQFGNVTMPPRRITNVIQSIQMSTPDSAAARLLTAFPGIAALQQELFYLAIWGVLQREILDHPIDSAAFAAAKTQLGLITELALQTADTEGEEFPLDRIMICLRDAIRLADEARQKEMVMALQGVVNHHLFQESVLPNWARVQSPSSEGWSKIKNILTMEIHLPFGAKGDASGEGSAAAITEGSEQRASGSSGDTLHQMVEADEIVSRSGWRPGMAFGEGEAGESPRASAVEGAGGANTLADKLRAEVSVESLKKVFGHEIHLFGKKKKDDP
jgi:serine/threonine protein kinase